MSFETPRSAISRSHSISASWPGGLVINHTCIDLDSIPEEWIDEAQANIRIHYAHTSHGGQITTGLSRIEAEDGNYSQARGSTNLPTEEGALCIYDGNGEHSYITPDLYWSTTEGLGITQATIVANPTFNVSLWSWCCQLTGYSEEQTQDYLDAMTGLEEANPHIIFVYMTNNAQATGASGYNRWLRNQQIRQYCLDNDKVLFDFADLDCWSNGINSTYEHTVDDVIYDIPVEHPDFNGNEAGHTTYSSCEQKGQAFWWLMAMLAGWNAPPPTTTTSTDTTTTTMTSSETTSSGETTTTSTTNGGSELLGSEALIITAGITGVLVIVVLIYRRR
jgi:hypothetical protein